MHLLSKCKKKKKKLENIQQNDCINYQIKYSTKINYPIKTTAHIIGFRWKKKRKKKTELESEICDVSL